MVRAPCCEKEGLKRGRWTDEEDDILTRYIQAKGEGSWRSVPQNAGLQRCGKSCRLRWINYLRPDLKRGNITAEEESVIIRLHASMGNRWSLIAGHLPGRTDNEIKNYWNSHLSRKILTYPNPASYAEVTELDPSAVGPADLTAERKPRRGRSRHRASNKNPSRNMIENEELEPMAQENTMQPDANEESFEITKYINDEGQAEESLIFSPANKPSYFNEELSEVLYSLDDSPNIKAEETEVNFSRHNSNTSSMEQKKGFESSKEVVGVAASWNESKSFLSLSSASNPCCADWDWKSLVNGQKLIDEDEMLSMLWDADDCSNFKCSNQQYG